MILLQMMWLSNIRCPHFYLEGIEIKPHLKIYLSLEVVLSDETGAGIHLYRKLLRDM